MRVSFRQIGSNLRKSPVIGKGFTLVELIVVITIMVAMMALAANMLRGGGKGQGLQSAVEMVDGLLKEAQLEAMGKGTWARLIVISTPDDPDSNMRTLAILTKSNKKSRKAWDRAGELYTLPTGFYISPQYSTALDAATGKKPKRDSFAGIECQDTTEIRGLGSLDYYFIEFDEEGRMSLPGAATRLVVVAGSAGDGKDERPMPMVDGRPGMAGGVVIYPKGNISRLRTEEQVFSN